MHRIRQTLAVAVSLCASVVVACTSAATPAATTGTGQSAAATTPPKPVASASASASAVSSPGIAPSPSPAAAVARPANANLSITSPTAGQSVPAGSIQVTIQYSGPPLVAAASATKLDDLHLHYFLDENAAPYLGTLVPVPAGNPRIVHTAATQVTFDSVPAGSHTVTVMLSASNHVSVTPPLSTQVMFTAN